MQAAVVYSGDWVLPFFGVLKNMNRCECMACYSMLAQVFKRGARPLGGGEVMLKVPIMKQLPPVNLVDEGVLVY